MPNGSVEGSGGKAIFVKRARARCPNCAPAFLGHTSRDLLLYIIDLEGFMVDAQGIEPWTSPV